MIKQWRKEEYLPPPHWASFVAIARQGVKTLEGLG